jgi:hypothetical protein
MLDARDFILMQIMRMMKHCRVAIKRNAHTAAGTLVNLGAQMLQCGLHFPKINVGADRMIEQRPQNFTMMMVHDGVPF